MMFLQRKPFPLRPAIIAIKENRLALTKKKSVYSTIRISTSTRWCSSSSANRSSLSTKPTRKHRCTRKIAIAMSGGVDSSVVAYLLSQNHSKDELIGIHMSNWDFADESPSETQTVKSNRNNSYCWEQDWKDASAVATKLKIPISHVSFESEYWNEVFQPYCQKLSQSITPNPDVDCNRYIKFGVLKDYLKTRFDNNIDYLATGHYARIWDRSRHNNVNVCTNTGVQKAIKKGMPEYLQQALDEEESSMLADYILHPSTTDTPLLLSARDRSKDQSYFLSGVSANAFSGVLFPLGDLYKTEIGRGSINVSEAFDIDNICDSGISVRQIAEHAQLPNATKRDSVGICFIGKRKHGEFIDEYVDHPLEDHDSGYSSSSASMMVQYINVENNEIVATFDPKDNPAPLYATIGQGAKIPGASQKWFVVSKQLQPPRNDNKNHQRWKSPCIFVCPGTHHRSLYADKFYVKSQNFNWIAGGEDNRPPPLPFRAKCRIRHLQPLVDCEITMSTEIGRLDGQSFEIRLEKPLRGIAPGQVCVVYAGGTAGDLICLGGGPIDEPGQNYWAMQKELPNVLHPSGHNDTPIREFVG